MEDRVKKRKTSPLLNVIVALLLVGLVAFVLVLIDGATKRPSSTSNSQPLDLTVVKKINGISLKTNEQTVLTGCKITLNDKYSVKLESIDNTEKLYLYSLFVDDSGTRFNFETTDPRSAYINDCKEDPSRSAAYTW